MFSSSINVPPFSRKVPISADQSFVPPSSYGLQQQMNGPIRGLVTPQQQLFDQQSLIQKLPDSPVATDAG